MFAAVGLAVSMLDAGDRNRRSAEPAILARGTAQAEHIAHFHFNLATGERIVTLIDDAVRPADAGGSPAVWLANNRLPCAGFGQTQGTVGVMDQPECTTCLPSTATGFIFLDWGDIEHDSVIDCVGVSWSVRGLDTDSDGDGVADGIPGFGARWRWYEVDNGFDDTCTAPRFQLAEVTLANLPGFLAGADPTVFPVYTATVDLGGLPGASQVFELGDSDSQSPAPNFHPGIYEDRDWDGLHDFSYSLSYFQPGTRDFDNADGDNDPLTGVDGDPADAAPTAWALATGNGTVDFDGVRYNYRDPLMRPDASGIEDAFDVNIDTNSDDQLEPIGTFWYGGLNCDTDPDVFNPFAQFYNELYGPGCQQCIECPADIGEPFGELNLFDISRFLGWFNQGMPRADLAEPFGVLNFFDVIAYISSYNACP